MNEAQPGSPPKIHFVTTRWTQVVLAKGDSPESQIALKELCDAYYHPVRQYVRARVGSQEQADDLTAVIVKRELPSSG